MGSAQAQGRPLQSLSWKTEPGRLTPHWALMAEGQPYQTLCNQERPSEVLRNLESPSPPYSLSGLDLRPREMSQVLQGYTSLGPDRSRKQFPRPPANRGQQARPDLGQAPAALGFVSLCLKTSRGHLILPLALSEKPSRQGSAIPALPLVGFSSHSLRPSSLPSHVLPLPRPFSGQAFLF